MLITLRVSNTYLPHILEAKNINYRYFDKITKLFEHSELITHHRKFCFPWNIQPNKSEDRQLIK